MKWIGQYIQQLISRFRNDVYLESLADPGSDTDKFLVADSNGKIGYRTGAEVKSDIGAGSGDGDITGVDLTGGTGIAIASETGTASGDYSATINCDLEGTELKSTGETGGSKFLREDGDGTCSWQTISSGGISHDGSTANGVLTYKDADEATVEADLTFDSEILKIGADDDGAAEIRRAPHSDDDAGDLYIRGGDATAGQTDKAGGNVVIFGGRSTSNAAGGSVQIKTNPASGSSGTTLQGSNTVATFRPDGDVLFNGSLIFEGATPDAHEIYLTPTDPGADATITVPAVTGTMAVSGASGSNMIILDSGSHYLNTITADEWYFGNNSFGRNYHYWNNVKASITADGGTFTITEDSNLIGRHIPEALSKVKLQLSARPSGASSTGEILSVCIISADRDGAGSNTTWTVLAQGEITQVQGEYDGVDITYTGSIPTTKMLAVGVGSSEASSINTTNTRFSYTLTGYLT